MKSFFNTCVHNETEGLHLCSFPAVDQIINLKVAALRRGVIVHPVGGEVRAVRVQRGDEGGRVGAKSRLPGLGQIPPNTQMPRRPEVPVAVAPHRGQQHRVHVGHEVAVARTVFRGRGRGRLGLGGGRGGGGRGVLETRRGGGGARDAGGVGDFQTAVLRLDRRGRRVSVQIGPPLPLPPEVAVVEHLLAVRVQCPVVALPWRHGRKHG